MGGVELATVDEEKDVPVDVTVHKSLKLGRHCKRAADNFHFREGTISSTTMNSMSGHIWSLPHQPGTHGNRRTLTY